MRAMGGTSGQRHNSDSLQRHANQVFTLATNRMDALLEKHRSASNLKTLNFSGEVYLCLSLRQGRFELPGRSEDNVREVGVLIIKDSHKVT
jgi:hypothetical protein